MCLLASLAILLPAPGAAQTQTKKPEEKPSFVVAGSVACKTLFAAPLAKKFGKLNSLDVRVYSGGSETGINAVYNRNADMAISTRPLTATERDKGLMDSVIAYDAIAVIVHKANPVENLTFKELNKILRGKIKNWKKLGWVDAPISVILPDTGSGMRTAFLRKILDKHKMKISPKEALSTYGAVAALREDSLAIAICSRTQTQYYHVKPLAVEGVVLNDTTMWRQEYPLLTPISIVTLGPPGPAARGFVHWITEGPAGKLLAEHFLPSARTMRHGQYAE